MVHEFPFTTASRLSNRELNFKRTRNFTHTLLEISYFMLTFTLFFNALLRKKTDVHQYWHQPVIFGQKISRRGCPSFERVTDHAKILSE